MDRVLFYDYMCWTQFYRVSGWSVSRSALVILIEFGNSITVSNQNNGTKNGPSKDFATNYPILAKNDATITKSKE